jgi:hypothetical protein
LDFWKVFKEKEQSSNTNLKCKLNWLARGWLIGTLMIFCMVQTSLPKDRPSSSSHSEASLCTWLLLNGFPYYLALHGLLSLEESRYASFASMLMKSA